MGSIRAFNFSPANRYLFLLVIIAAGVILRGYRLSYQSLWLDELYSIVPTSPDNSLTSIIDYCRTDQPPAFFILVHAAFKLFGYSESVGRGLAALFGVLSIPAIFFLTREFGGERAGLFAGAIVSLNYIHIYYSQELRFYSLLFLLATLSHLFFFRGVKHGRIRNYAGYVVFTSGLLYTHYFGLLVFAVHCFVLLLMFVKQRLTQRRLLEIIATGIAVLMLFAPWLPTVVNDLTASSWIKTPDPQFFFEYFYQYTGKDALVTTTLFFCIGLGVWRRRTEKSMSNVDVLLFSILLGYGIPYLWSVFSEPVLHIRYTLSFLPLIFVTAAVGWEQVANLKWQRLILFVLILSSVVNLFFVRKYFSKIHKTQFRESAAWIVENNDKQYPIFTPMPWHYNYYFNKHGHQAFHLDSLYSNRPPYAFVVTAHYFAKEQVEQDKQRMLKEFEIISSHSFFDADGFLLKRK